MHPEPVLHSTRLRLREFVAGDVPALRAMHRDARVRALLVDDYPLEHALVAETFVQRLAHLYRLHEGLGVWHAERRAVSGAWLFCGWFNLMPMPDSSGRVEIGCRLLPDAWGTGLAIEGGGVLLRHAFDTLALPAVWGVCHPEHRAVRWVLGTLGFASQGVALYDGQVAAMQRIDADSWRTAAARPLRQRRREAVLAARAGRAMARVALAA